MRNDDIGKGGTTVRFVGVAALGVAVMAVGVAVGALPITGVEPPGLSYISCGPAVFDRQTPLPHPACAAAYAPLPFLAWTFLSAGLFLVLTGLLLARRNRKVLQGQGT